ncbi:UNVERIFIED_CONTAM: hypothetical protein FKN15_051874 [Acipenser sinensis]
MGVESTIVYKAVFQAISCGIHYLASVFLAETPKFVCGAPGNITAAMIANYSGSGLEDIWSHWNPGQGFVLVETESGELWELNKCSRSRRTDSFDFDYSFSGNKSEFPCSEGFVYDRTNIQQSIVTDWNLVCDKEWLAKLTQPSFMFGVLIGALIFGDIADRVGRRTVMMFTSTCQFVFGIAVAFTANYYVFIVIRFMLAMAISCGIHYLASVFLAETPKFVCGAPGNITAAMIANYSGSGLEDIWSHWNPGQGFVLVETESGELWELNKCSRSRRTDSFDFDYSFSGNKSEFPCSEGFVYDRTNIQQSIVTDWNLVCDKEWLAKLTQPSFMFGVLIGALIFGDIADRYPFS